MKVALLSFDFGEYCIRLASAMADEADVALLLPTYEAAGHLSLLAPSVRLYQYAKPRLRQPLQQLGMVATNLRRIRRFDPDVVHIQQGHLWFNPTLPLLARYPLVVTVHDPYHHLGDTGAQKTPQSVMEFGFRRAARLIVHSQQQKGAVVERSRIDGRRIDVIPHIALGDLDPVKGRFVLNPGGR